MKRCASILSLLLLSVVCTYGQAFSFRDTPFLIKTFTPVAAANDPVFNNITHYYPMSESSGTRADTKGAVNLTESGGTINSGTGIRGNAATWTVATAGVLTESTYGQNTQDGTIYLWFNASAVTVTHEKLFSGNGSADYFLRIYLNVATPTIEIGSVDDGILASATFTLNNWHLIIIAQSDGSVFWSRDGGSFSTDLAPSGNPNGSSITVGDSLVLASLIDEVGVWISYKFTDADAATVWNGGSGRFFTP